MNSGHYLAEIQINSIWYEANDTYIKQIGMPSAFSYSKTPCIFLYRKVVHNIDFTIHDPIINTNTVTSKMQEQALKEIEIQKKKICDIKNKQINSETPTNSSTKSPGGRQKKIKKLEFFS